MMKLFRMSAVIATMAVIMAGCAGGGTSSNLPPDPTIRVFNGMHDGPACDFFYDDDTIATNIAFRESSADFTEHDPLLADVTLLESGTTNEIWAETFDFERDRDYLIAALGIVNFGSEPLKRARLFRHEINRLVPNGSKARLYVINGFNRSAGNLTTPIDVQNPGNNPLFALRDIAFGGSQGALIDAVNQTLEVRRTGTETIYVSNTFTFAPGKVYALFILGVESGTGNAIPRMDLVELQTE